MKRNTGIMTIVTVGNKTFEIDGYVKRNIVETLCSTRTIMTLDWTNLKTTEPVLAESNFIEDNNGNVLEVEEVEIDAYESRKFNSYIKLSEAIENFMKGVK